MKTQFQLGLEELLNSTELLSALKGRRVALVAHPASVDQKLEHSLDLLKKNNVNVTACFGPQHGMRGEKQDNMIETTDYVDPIHKVPVFSLYGEHRRPTELAMSHFDVCLFDLQDIGTRIYTFLTTLVYMMEACSQHGKSLWILDRPNPAGRPTEGTRLIGGWESFVGAVKVPMRHGLTLGEMALWIAKNHNIKLDLKIVKMKNYSFQNPWPMSMPWVNPSPNAPNIFMARAFPGTVMLEGTHLSEGRGTTRPLEIMGAPDLDHQKLLTEMHRLAPDWLEGCVLRLCFFEPTFHKHQKNLCQGIQIHTDTADFDENKFKPYRVVALYFKAIRNFYGTYEIWRNFPYEYEFDRLAIDLINGGDQLRLWVDDPKSKPGDLDSLCLKSEREWDSERQEFLIYS